MNGWTDGWMDGWTDGGMLSANNVPKSCYENQTQRLRVHVEVEGDNESVNEGRVMCRCRICQTNVSNLQDEVQARASNKHAKWVEVKRWTGSAMNYCTI